MIISPEAEADLADAWDWYEKQHAGLGAEFILCVEEVLARIERTPAVYRIVYREVRRALTRRFPYAVYDRIVADDVEILAVLHAQRDPKQWQTRL